MLLIHGAFFKLASFAKLNLLLTYAGILLQSKNKLKIKIEKDLPLHTQS